VDITRGRHQSFYFFSENLGYGVSSLTLHTIYNDTVLFTTIQDGEATNVHAQIQAVQLNSTVAKLRWAYNTSNWVYNSKLLPSGVVTDDIGNSYALYYGATGGLYIVTVDFAGTPLWSFQLSTVSNGPSLTGITSDGILTVWDGTSTTYLLETTADTPFTTTLEGRVLAIHNNSFIVYQVMCKKH
jgi:hypothetical protein